MSKSVLLAGSNVSPIGLEWNEHGFYTYADAGSEARRWGSSSWEICGCCGARYADTIEKFNTTFANSDMYKWENQYKTYNRGICVGLNLPINEVKSVPGSVVEHIQCGDDVLSLRLRMEQVYGD